MIKCLEHCEKLGRFALTSNSAYLVVFDIISNELVLHHISVDVHVVVACAVTHVLKTFVVVSGPEEWGVTIRDELAKHVECCVRTLIESVDPMFNPGLLAGLPIWERTDVTSSKDVWGRGL